VIGTAEVMDRVKPGMLGTTFGGNPAGCAAALATIAVIEEEGLLERAAFIGSTLQARLSTLQAQVSALGDVRGAGAMVGLEFVREDGHTPDHEFVGAVVALARENGLILLPTGTYGNVIRLLPPLRLADEELEAGLEILERAILSVAQGTLAVA